jgi:hypothetical protein
MDSHLADLVNHAQTRQSTLRLCADQTVYATLLCKTQELTQCAAHLVVAQFRQGSCLYLTNALTRDRKILSYLLERPRGRASLKPVVKF